MRRTLALALTVALVLTPLASSNAQLSEAGVVTGTLSGPNGVLGGITVQVLDPAGSIVGSAVTTSTGTFSISGLSTGTFTIQAIGSNGAVIGVSSMTLAEGAMTAAVAIDAGAGALAASAATAVTQATAGTAGITSGAVLAAVGAAAAAIGTAAVVATGEPASGSR